MTERLLLSWTTLYLIPPHKSNAIDVSRLFHTPNLLLTGIRKMDSEPSAKLVQRPLKPLFHLFQMDTNAVERVRQSSPQQMNSSTKFPLTYLKTA